STANVTRTFTVISDAGLAPVATTQRTDASCGVLHPYKEAAARAIRLARRPETWPLASYQRTARSRAAATGPGRKPSSRCAREQSTNILWRAIFTPSIGMPGSRNVSREKIVLA